MQEKKRKEHLFLGNPNYIIALNSCVFAFTSDSATEERKGRQMLFLADKSYRAAGHGRIAQSPLLERAVPESDDTLLEFNQGEVPGQFA
jgi:hypothetical protein